MFKQISRCNIKHALKVQNVYDTITSNLRKRKIYGSKRVIARSKEMVKALDMGLITHQEYKQWRISQKII